MPWIEVALLALALCMDALAVSIAYGIAMGRWRWGLALRIALFFGGFQALMPALGWLAGVGMHRYIASLDHWVAFALLGFIGGKMLWDTLRGEGEPVAMGTDVGTLLAMATATSIDALAAGVSLAMTQASIAATACAIGGITFCVCLLGVGAGKRLGTAVGRTATLVGGLV
ncbi:MAG: manganese efflux pump MntP family protein, partial [Oscillospiraceae bacterium]|nr:manganese efflux pump MntP family protein [Oscillospiraceae bacterium]